MTNRLRRLALLASAASELEERVEKEPEKFDVDPEHVRDVRRRIYRLLVIELIKEAKKRGIR